MHFVTNPSCGHEDLAQDAPAGPAALLNLCAVFALQAKKMPNTPWGYWGNMPCATTDAHAVMWGKDRFIRRRPLFAKRCNSTPKS